MRVFILKADANNFQTLVTADREMMKEYKRFNGSEIEKLDSSWCAEIYQGEDKPSSDFPSLASHIPVFNQTAIVALEGLLESNGEFFPLCCLGCDKSLKAFNVTTVVDALDADNSEIKRFKSSGRVMRINKYQFDADKLGQSIFKLPETPLMSVFVTDEFVAQVKKSELTGFLFEEVWSDEA